MEFSLRCRSNPTIRMREDLAKSTGSLSTLMDNHSDMMRSSRTSWKRLDAISKFVTEKQAETGPEWAEMSKRSARGTAPKEEPYPLREVYSLSGTPKGDGLRDPPLSAVK